MHCWFHLVQSNLFDRWGKWSSKILSDLPRITELLINCQSSHLNSVLAFSLFFSISMRVCVFVCVCISLSLSLSFDFSMVMRWKPKVKNVFLCIKLLYFLTYLVFKESYGRIQYVIPYWIFPMTEIVKPKDMCVYVCVRTRTNTQFISFNQLFKFLFNFWESITEVQRDYSLLQRWPSK